MKKCPFCAEDIQEAAVVCKHCGRDLAGGAPREATAAAAIPGKKKTSPIVIGCLVIFVILLGLGIVGSILDPSPRSSQPGAAPAAPPTGDITMAKFNEIHEGMTYEQVVQILGSPGEVQSSSELAGYKTVMYAWKAKRGIGNMNAMFQNGKLVTKAQFGLH